MGRGKLGAGPMVKLRGRDIDVSAVIKAQSAIRARLCLIRIGRVESTTKPKKKVMVLGGKKKTEEEKKAEADAKARAGGEIISAEKKEARRQIKKKRDAAQDKGRDRLIALRGDIEKAEVDATGAYVGPQLMDVVLQRFLPKGITKQDLDKLAAVNNTTTQFDLC